MYTYERLCEDIAYLGYNGIDVGTVGKSVLGLNIPYVHLGDYSGKQIIITAGIHARENVTCLLAIRQAFFLAFERAPFDGGIYILPMLNPDGALLIEKGAYALGGQRLIDINGGSNDFSMWKANINGVDLNNNFDARFGEGAGQKHMPAPHGFIGAYPASEPETKTLVDFTLSVRPALTLSYHALGREVYWNFFQNEASAKRDRDMAKKISDHMGYDLIDADLNSTGGYKDWCIETLKIPAFTVEIVSSAHTHPLSLDVLDEDYEVNKDIPVLLTKML